MRPGRVLLVYAMAVFVGGALLAPWLYWLAQWAAQQWPACQGLARSPFHRYVNRALLGLALLGLWPLVRALGMGSWRNLGWVRPHGQGRRLAAGFALGFVSLAAVGAGAILCGAWEWQALPGPGRLAGRLAVAALSAVVVAMLEETFFRGAVLGTLQRVHSAAAALLASSAIYALLHFFQRPPSPETVHWLSGLELLPRMMRGFVEVRMLAPGFFNLTLAGIILGLAYQRTGNLYFSMGLHGGWVFWLKFWGVIGRVAEGGDSWWWGSPGRLIDGWLTVVALGAVLLALPRLAGPKEKITNGTGTNAAA